MADRDPWELAPFESVGPLRFGMTRDEVIATVGEPQLTRRSKHDSRFGSDQYQTFRAGYDRDQRLLSVECNRSQPVSYEGWMLTGRQSSEVEEWAKGHGLTVKRSYEGMWIRELSLAFWTPEDDLAPPDSILFVLAGRSDYWQFVPEPREDPVREREGQ
jgi:hypothetical protein